MSDEDALLNAIAANPDEDTPRLMFADWLDEHGQSIRAEFIRGQIAIAQKEHLPRAILNRYVDLFKRNQELIDNHRAELLGPLVSLRGIAEMPFHRGFPERVEMNVRVFLEHSEILARQRPLPRICVTGIIGRLIEFLLNKHTDIVTHVLGYSEALDDVPPRYFDDLDGDMAYTIEQMKRLELLDLEGCGVSDIHCAMTHRFSVPTLRDLDLSNNLITDHGIDHLLQTALPQQLNRLILGGNNITDSGAIALAEQWPVGKADRLEYLNMRFTNIGQAGQRALLDRFGGRVDLF